MSRDEAPLSTHAADQAWFSMLLVNDPNTALVASLRPSRQHPLWAALRRPFERQAPHPTLDASEIPGLRPRRAPWITAGLLVLAVAGMAGSSRLQLNASASSPQRSGAAPEFDQQRAPQALAAPLAKAPEPHQAASALATSVAPLSRQPSARPPEASPLPAPASAATVAPAPSAKKKSAKAAKRSLQRELSRALTGRRTSR